MNQFLHTIYGLTIALPIKLPGLASGDGEIDVQVSFGATPERLQDSPDNSKPFQVAGDKMLLRIPAVAGFLVRNGREIVIEKEKGADDDDVRLFLPGNVMGGGSALSWGNPASWHILQTCHSPEKNLYPDEG